MKNYFITGTGTGVGKTLLTCVLAYQLGRTDKSVRALKPVISGFDASDPAQSDSGLLLAAQGLQITRESLEDISPWRFAAPLSPDMAAEDEGKEIDLEKLAKFCRQQSGADYLLIEGVGGVMVPLNASCTVLDWALALNFPVILVTGSYLGSLSHTLLSARALLSAGLALHAVVISESEYSPVPLLRMEEALRRHLPEEVRFLTVGRLASSPELWKYSPELLQRLFL